ncbi:Spherulation-specific family 4 [Kalmanozyma brasiliensis GHG001]|uniref:Spherulin 4 n=1 Tax=Kalmanozyma brasiliensis (strain GHG001) TaxID=1365824 RepID=V5GLC4_KALBG|nr:Spherulation-specific family 4 [Kalmanozyma brasiliensis GHG001]EST06757.1 Spherulation-specific family 4 [Kalmanozyma brasiliensis GHG001]
MRNLSLLLVIAMMAALLQTVASAATKKVNTKTPRILVPLYIYPEPGAWDPLYTAIRNSPSAAFLVIINPNSGPGDGSAPDSDYASAIQQLRSTAAANQTLELIGYVPTGYGKRSASQVKSFISTYAKWPRSVRPDGIFFDETITSQKYLAKYRNYTDFVKSQSWGVSTKTPSNATYAQRKGITMLNPGTWPESDKFWSIADHIVVYEDKLSNFDFGEYQQLTQNNVPVASNFQRSYIFYNVDSANVTTKDGRNFMGVDALVNATIRVLASRGGLFITDLKIGEEDVYAKFSGIWQEFVKMVGASS